MYLQVTLMDIKKANPSYQTEQGFEKRGSGLGRTSLHPVKLSSTQRQLPADQKASIIQIKCLFLQIKRLFSLPFPCLFLSPGEFVFQLEPGEDSSFSLFDCLDWFKCSSSIISWYLLNTECLRLHCIVNKFLSVSLGTGACPSGQVFSPLISHWKVEPTARRSSPVASIEPKCDHGRVLTREFIPHPRVQLWASSAVKECCQSDKMVSDKRNLARRSPESDDDEDDSEEKHTYSSSVSYPYLNLLDIYLYIVGWRKGCWFVLLDIFKYGDKVDEFDEYDEYDEHGDFEHLECRDKYEYYNIYAYSHVYKCAQHSNINSNGQYTISIHLLNIKTHWLPYLLNYQRIWTLHQAQQPQHLPQQQQHQPQ